jgi:DNA-binding NarL/FixJ family response regulator
MLKAIRLVNSNMPIVVVLDDEVLGNVLEFVECGASLVVSSSVDGIEMARLINQITKVLHDRQPFTQQEQAARIVIPGKLRSASAPSTATRN